MLKKVLLPLLLAYLTCSAVAANEFTRTSPIVTYCDEYLSGKFLKQMFPERSRQGILFLIGRRVDQLENLSSSRAIDGYTSMLLSKLTQSLLQDVDLELVTGDEFEQIVHSFQEGLDQKLRTHAFMDWERAKLLLEVKHPPGWRNAINSQQFMLDFASELQETGEPLAALACLDRAIVLNPDVVAPYLARAKNYASQEDFLSAFVEANQVIGIDSSSRDARVLRCEAALACSDFEQAIADGEMLLGLKQAHDDGTLSRLKSTIALALLGNCLASDQTTLGDAELRAIYSQACAKALELDPACAEAYYVRACHVTDGQTVAEKQADLRKAIELDNLFLAAKYQLAISLIESASPSGLSAGIALCDEISQQAPDPLDSSFTYCLRAEALLFQEQPEASLVWWAKAIESFPKNIHAFRRRADVYQELGNSDKASQDRAEAAGLSQVGSNRWRVKLGGFPDVRLALSPKRVGWAAPK